ncbi:hypothetical protein [Amaricoccus sp. W119]|uniref:hypothetical protein n=1 Tax=Amaricoccus sp. W119 TaxID=3391833 RepID=UPI0039A72676
MRQPDDPLARLRGEPSLTKGRGFDPQSIGDGLGDRAPRVPLRFPEARIGFLAFPGIEEKEVADAIQIGVRDRANVE